MMTVGRNLFNVSKRLKFNGDTSELICNALKSSSISKVTVTFLPRTTQSHPSARKKQTLINKHAQEDICISRYIYE